MILYCIKNLVEFFLFVYIYNFLYLYIYMYDKVYVLVYLIFFDYMSFVFGMGVKGLYSVILGEGEQILLYVYLKEIVYK